MMLTQPEFITEKAVLVYTQHHRWWKNEYGWCHSIVRTYQDGDRQQDIIEWGLSDKEYFKRKLEDKLND